MLKTKTDNYVTLCQVVESETYEYHFDNLLDAMNFVGSCAGVNFYLKGL